MSELNYFKKLFCEFNLLDDNICKSSKLPIEQSHKTPSLISLSPPPLPPKLKPQEQQLSKITNEQNKLSSSLLDEIQNISLKPPKKVEPVRELTDKEKLVLDIQNFFKVNKLKKLEDITNNSKQEDNSIHKQLEQQEDNSIYKQLEQIILSRRYNLADSESEDDSDDDPGKWDGGKRKIYY